MHLLYKPSLESKSKFKALKLGAWVLNYQFYRSSRRPRAQRAADSQQQTVTSTTTLNHITIYSTILYCTIKCYTLLVLLVLYLYYFVPAQVPVVYYCDPPPSVSPDRKTSSGGGRFINVTVTLLPIGFCKPPKNHVARNEGP